jgi:drug/metabolite transporter (DMT)-like permease
MSDDPTRVRVALAFTCILLVWGTTYLAIAIVLRSLPPFASAAMRFLLAALLLYGGLRLQGPRPLAGLPTRTVIASGILMCGLGNGFTVFAMQGVPSGVAALLNSTIPICVTLLDWGFFHKRRPRIWTGIGLVVGVGGVALIVDQTATLSGLRGAGYLAALALAVTAWSIGTLLQRNAVPRARLLALGCGQMAAGGAFLCLAALVHGEVYQLDLAAVTSYGWFALLYLVAFGSVLAQSSYLWLLARVPAEKVTTYAVINPAIALVLGGLVLDETVTGASAFGALLVLAGVSLVLFERRVGEAVRGWLGGSRHRRS